MAEWDSPPWLPALLDEVDTGDKDEGACPVLDVEMICWKWSCRWKSLLVLPLPPSPAGVGVGGVVMFTPFKIFSLMEDGCMLFPMAIVGSVPGEELDGVGVTLLLLVGGV